MLLLESIVQQAQLLATLAAGGGDVGDLPDLREELMAHLSAAPVPGTPGSRERTELMTALGVGRGR